MIDQLNDALEARYRVERELGEGGMATVYLAHDLKHDRKVALKVLRPELAAVVGAERFLAEIRTTANLEDPHILPLYDSGVADSFLYYVMPYVEGDSLRDRLDREHQLPVDEALDIARKVAGALQYAHDQGVVHRDVKPANILLRRGEPLVADFGIALALSEAGSGRITETGLSLGTPHYMSPEQASGERTLDPRSDVYALACVLYEMLTGEPPHAGPTAQAVLAKILTEQPRRVRDLRKAVPENVDAALARALEKLPADRMASAGAFVEALDDPGYRYREKTEERRAVPAVQGTPRRWKAAAAILAVTTLGLAAATVLSRPEPASDPAVFRVSMALPEDQSLLTPQLGSSLALSPDGSRLVYAGASASAPWQLWLRRASELRATPLPETQASFTPTFSPGSDQLAFVNPEGVLRILDLERGAVRTLTDSTVWVLDWTTDGYIYYQRGVSMGDTWRIHAAGGEPEPVPVISGPLGPTPLWGPGDVLPGGRAMVITRFPEGNASAGGATIAVVDFDTREVRDLGPGVDPRYLPPGYLLWGTRDGTLMAAPFDADALEATGPAVPVAGGILLDVTSVMHYGVSRNGSLVYRSGGSSGGVGRLVWVDRDGTTAPASDLDVGLTVGLWDSVDLSPDGSRVALAIADGLTSHIWVQPLAEKAPPNRVTFGGTFNVRPRWTPDGRGLTFVSNLGGQGVPTQLWRKPADGAGAPTLLVQSEREVEEGLVSPDGQWIVYRLGGTASNRDIYAVRAGTDSVGAPLVATARNERAAALSPDGRWMAYVSDEGGRDEVFVAPFPDVASGKWQISAGGGGAPAWSHDGTELFYVGASNELMAARYQEAGGSFVVTDIQSLFSTSGLIMGVNNTSYAVAPDDDRFLAISLGNREAGLVWVQNWLAELQAFTAPQGGGR
jgi:serine/threonine protein kinase